MRQLDLRGWLPLCTVGDVEMESLPSGTIGRLECEERSGFRRRNPAWAVTPSTGPALWHVRRHRRILEQHPELRQLFGTDPWTALWIAGLVATQYALGFALRHALAWRIVLAIFFVGAPIAHALGVLIHECAHNLIFRATWKNKLLSIVANLGLVAPAAVDFRHKHLRHHRLLGDAREPEGGDSQAPTTREIRMAARSPWRRLFCYTFGHFFSDPRAGNKVPRDAWFVANVATCVAVGALVGLGLGLRSLSYLLLSVLFAFGPHPLGARRLSEHWTLRRGQPTCSYYGPANWVSFQVGHHVEHHDFPHVPWSRVRRLHALAREHYEPLASFSSWTRLLLQHLFERRWDRGHYVGFSEDYSEEDVSSTGEGAIDLRDLPRLSSPRGWDLPKGKLSE